MWENSTGDNTNHWTVSENWKRWDGVGWPVAPAGEYPGAAGRTDDEALINDSSNWGRETRCVLDVPVTLKKLEIGASFAKDFTLEQTLTVKDGTVDLNSSDAVGAMLSGGTSQKQIRLTGAGTTFKWRSGTLFTIQVIAEAGTSVVLPVRDPLTEVQNPSLSMAGASIDVNEGGTLDWQWRNVMTAMAIGLSPGASSANLINVHPGGTFKVTARSQSWGHTSPSALVVSNSGSLLLDTTTRAVIGGSFTTTPTGETTIWHGTLEVTGPMTLDGGEMTIYTDAAVHPHNTAGVLDVINGTLAGGGKVEGSVVMYGGTLDPSGNITWEKDGPGKFTITCLLDMRGGRIEIDIWDRNRYDRVEVGGKVTLAGTARGWIRILPPGEVKEEFQARDRVDFLTSTGDKLHGDFAIPPTPPEGWRPGKNETRYWFQQIGVIAGVVRNDADGDGVFEPANGETVLAGVPVELLDADDNVVDTTTSAADGSYLFDELGVGTWKVRFARPAALRPVGAGQGSDPTLDSDYDYGTLLAAVTLTEANPTATRDALFRPLTAVDDEYHTTSGASVSGNVALNDPPAAGDTLTFALAPGSGPAAGLLDFHADGTFTYTAPSVPHGSPTVAVTFQYIVTDSYGHTATGTVTIYVAPFWNDGGPGDPPPP